MALLCCIKLDTATDPCMGSGHILVRIFGVLMQIYESQGYAQRDAVQSILRYNLYGLDIDQRAAQLAYFAVMMKARQYDRRIFSRRIQPHVFAIVESNDLSGQWVVGNEQMQTLFDCMKDAKEYGSILTVPRLDFDSLRQFAKERTEQIGQLSMENMVLQEQLPQVLALLDVAETLAQKYEVVITNPPYLGSSRFSLKLDKYVKENYAEEKSDLSMVMLKKAMRDFSRRDGFISFITTSSWMFLSSFEKTRNYMFSNLAISSLVDYGTELFEGKVGHNPIVSWTNRNTQLDYKLTAIRLVDYCYSRRDEKEPEFFEARNRYTVQQSNFAKIPGSPVAYWVSEVAVKAFQSPKIEDIAFCCKGLDSGDNNRFLRFWQEVDWNLITFDSRDGENTVWVPHNKGGAYRRWYGNREYVINWRNGGKEIKEHPGSRPQNINSFFTPVFTWSTLSSASIAFRYLPEGSTSDSKGSIGKPQNESILLCLGFLNTCVCNYFMKLLAPTLDYSVGSVKRLPYLHSDQYAQKIVKIVDECIDISRTDWDSFETSWDFTCHPFVKRVLPSILIPMETAFEELKVKEATRDFLQSPDKETAYQFVRGYFDSRSKQKLFNEAIMEMDEGTVKERSVHIVSAFLLGWYIQKKMGDVFTETNNKGEEGWSFEYLWFLSCMYHDTFSGAEKPIGSLVNNVSDVVKVNKKAYTIFDGEILGVKLPRPTYSRKIVENYFKMRIEVDSQCKLSGIDHGIRGGYVAFQKLVENYLEEREKNGNKDTFCTCLTGEFNGHVLCWDKEQIEAYAIASDAIVAHNLWHKTKDDSDYQIYKKYGLTDLIVDSSSEQRISRKKSPLAYLLSLVDTIEPTKVLKKYCILNNVADTLSEAEISQNITIGIKSNCIVIGQSNRNLFDLETWYKDKMCNMSDWLQDIYAEYDGERDRIIIEIGFQSSSEHLSEKYKIWKAECEKQFSQLKSNEEELNRIFIDIYRLQDELTPEVEDKEVTVRKADLGRDIRSLLSYAVGCMFGRYSLDVDGLAYAGGEWDNSKYVTFIPDKDNAIPITDEAYFEDDIVGLFCKWLKTVYGEDTLEENLDFIAKALGNKGDTSRDVIRNYFLNDFIKDHIRIYQKRPIYWLFDSGKKNGFKCLVYMHRWNADTAGNVRVEYLHKLQHVYEREIQQMQETIEEDRDRWQVARAMKRRDKLQKQLKETQEYDAKLGHIALCRIDIDLDDGVKVNYEKVQTGRDGKKMQILTKI